MTASLHPELHGLAMRPGRRRMLDLLSAAGADGAPMAALAVAFRDGGSPVTSQAAASEMQRLRSQVASLGYTLRCERPGLGRTQPGRFVLARKAERAGEVVPARASVAPSSAMAIPTPAERLGIRATTRRVGAVVVSVARCATLEGATS